jgi:hypothetical protein
MKKFNNYLITLVILIFFSACSNRVFVNKAFLSQNSIDDKTVAILPVEVLLTGRLPKGFSEAQKVKQQNLESKFYQDMLYSEFLGKASRSNKRKAGVMFLNPREVNKKLNDKGINNENLRDKSMEELATITGADMVLIVTIKKNRLMSDGAAIGIDVAESVLNSVLKTPNTNNVATRTYDIAFDASLIDGQSGTTINKLANFRQANWQNDPGQVVRRNYATTTRKFGVFAKQ